MTPSTAGLVLGSTQQYQATGTYTDGSSQNLTGLVAWSVVPNGSASISPTGLVTPIEQGDVEVNAAYAGVNAVAALVVGGPNLVSLVVSPTSASIQANSNQQFVATGTYTDGSTRDVTSSVSWTSSAGTVATIGSTGLAAALSDGNATVTAASGGITASATLNVQQRHWR